MKLSFLYTTIVLLFFTQIIRAQDDDYYTKIDHLTINMIPPTELQFVTIGEGFNMTNPWSPVHAPNAPFKITTPAMIEKVKRLSQPKKVLFKEQMLADPTSNNYSYKFDQSVDETTLAQFFYADISAGGLGWGVSAAVNYVHNNYNVANAIKVTIQDEYTETVNSSVNANWKILPFSTSPLLSDQQKWHTFKSLYGSHYVSSLVYGWRIEIVVFANTTNDNSKLSIKTAFDTWAISGSLGADISTSMHRATTSISAKIFCGSIKDNNNSTLPFVLTSLDQVIDFLNKLHAGQITISGGPIAMSLVSYNASICQSYPQYCKYFDIGSIPLDVNVIPRGTIFQWTPPREYINKDGSVNPPPGAWLVCDARNHQLNPNVPDLSSTFIMGADGNSPIGTSGGRNFVTLNATTTEVLNDPKHFWAVGQAGAFHTQGALYQHKHDVNFGDVDIRPKYYAVVYIIKM